MEEIIAGEILNLYSQLPLNGKPSDKQYTVLSGVVAKISPSSISDVSRNIPICLCTGTKCLSNHDTAFQQGVTLSDSHAEILARRSLIRYLLLSAIEILKSPEYASQDNCPFQLLHQKNNEGQQIFSLKSEWSFWLYISDSPCGDASVYQRTSLERSFTGKKSQPCGGDGVISSTDSDPFALSSLLRCKPGRIDIQGTQRASSMSCSDKICRWSCLGLQGFVSPFSLSCHISHQILRALLSKFITSPIFLSGIVISRDLASSEVEGQEEAVQRAIPRRLKLSFPQSRDRNHCENTQLQPAIPQIAFSSLQFESGKCHMETQQYSHAAPPPVIASNGDTRESEPDDASESQELNQKQTASPILSKRKRKAKALLEQNPCSELKSCSTNINWIRLVGLPETDSRTHGHKKRQQYCQNGSIEITLANTGRPQGTTKSSALKSQLSMESRLCRRYVSSLSPLT
jgi:hypothetical protein